MNEKDVIEFFDSVAPNWDAGMIRDDEKIRHILNVAGVCEGCRVLDVATGTGVLIPDYLERNVEKIVAFDISPNMIAVAKQKFQNESKVELQCTGIEGLRWEEPFDCAIIYDAFPHFMDVKGLVERLANVIRPGGRLTIAHDRGIDQLNMHHSGAAKKVSNDMITTGEMAELLEMHFVVDYQQSEEEIYIVSGRRI